MSSHSSLTCKRCGNAIRITSAGPVRRDKLGPSLGSFRQVTAGGNTSSGKSVIVERKRVDEAFRQSMISSGGSGGAGTNGRKTSSNDSRLARFRDLVAAVSRELPCMPMCASCMEHVQVELGTELDDLVEECKMYQELLADYSATDPSAQPTATGENGGGAGGDESTEGDSGGPAGGERQSKTEDSGGAGGVEGERNDGPEFSVDEVEPRAQNILQSVLSDRRTLQRELAQLRLEEQSVSQYEQVFWRECQDLQFAMHEVATQRETLRASIIHNSKSLERLKRTNVLSDAFHITYRGHFGTINGFRVGCLKTEVVDNVEINAALGEIVLMLDTIARSIGFSFGNIRLLPLGTDSRIERKVVKGKGHSLETVPLFMKKKSKFNAGLCLLFECICDLCVFLEKGDERVCFPYKMDRNAHRIEGKTVQYKQNAAWTEAMRFLMGNLQQLLVCVTRRRLEDQQSSRARQRIGDAKV